MVKQSAASAHLEAPILKVGTGSNPLTLSDHSKGAKGLSALKIFYPFSVVEFRKGRESIAVTYF